MTAFARKGKERRRAIFAVNGVWRVISDARDDNIGKAESTWF